MEGSQIKAGHTNHVKEGREVDKGKNTQVGKGGRRDNAEKEIEEGEGKAWKARRSVPKRDSVVVRGLQAGKTVACLSLPAARCVCLSM